MTEWESRALQIRAVRPGVLCAAMTLFVASCSQPPPVLGYRDVPTDCSIVQESAIVEQLGREAVQEANPADVHRTDTARSVKCEWKSSQSPRWGNPANATISVIVRVLVTEDGDPDVQEAEGRYRRGALSGEDPDKPPKLIGDGSRHRFESATSGSQVAMVDFRRANVYVVVEYSGIGWNRNGSSEHCLPRADHEAATRAIARQVSAALGEPQ